MRCLLWAIAHLNGRSWMDIKQLWNDGEQENAEETWRKA
jgi:hypothetical protein